MSNAIFLQLCEITGRAPAEYSYELVFVKNEPRRVRLPSSLTRRVSELLGILAGDGHVSLLKYQVSVCGHKQLDREYIVGHVAPLIESVFGAEPFVRDNYTTVYCRFYSKPVVLMLNREYEVPLGKKKGHLRIPKKVFENALFLKDYIRGLFDTDGSIYRHHKNDAAIDITSMSPRFRADIVMALKKLGFHPTMNGKNVQLYRKAEIRRFFEVIRPANRKHLIKYGALNNLGYLPKANDLFAAVV